MPSPRNAYRTDSDDILYQPLAGNDLEAPDVDDGFDLCERARMASDREQDFSIVISLDG